MPPYKYVTDQDLTEARNLFSQQGYAGDNLTEAMRFVADDLEVQRGSQKGNTFLKTLMVSVPQEMSMQLKGIQPILNPRKTEAQIEEEEDGGTPDNMFWDIAKSMISGISGIIGDEIDERFVQPQAQRSKEIAVSAQGPKWGKGSGRTWSTLVAQNLPMMMSAPFNPPGMMTREAQGFVESTEGYLDPDIQDRYASEFGGISGAIEYAQNLLALGPLIKNLRRAGADKVVVKIAQKTLATALKNIARVTGKEIGVAGIEGAEEVSQGMVYNHIINKAVADQNQRNRERGLPDITEEQISEMKQEDLADSFITGAGIALITRGGGHVVGGVKAVRSYNKARKEIVKNITKNIIEQLKASSKEAAEMIDSGMSIHEVTKTIKAIAPDLKPLGYAQSQIEALRGVTPQDLKEKVNSLPYEDLFNLAEAWGIPTKGATPASIRQSAYVIIDELQGKLPQGVFLLKAKNLGLSNEMLLDSLQQEVDRRKGRWKKKYQEAIEKLSVYEGNIHDLSKTELNKVLGYKTEKGKILATVFERIVEDKAAIENDDDIITLLPIVNPAEQGEVEMGTKIGDILRKVINNSMTTSDYVVEFIRDSIIKGDEGQVEFARDTLAYDIGPERASDIVEALRTDLNADIELSEGETRAERTATLVLSIRDALNGILPEKTINKLITAQNVQLKGTDNLHEVLTRDQYAKYRIQLQGQLADIVQTKLSQASWLTMKAQIDTSIVTPIPLRDGGNLDITEMPVPDDIPLIQQWWRRLGPLQPSLDYLQEKFGIRFKSMSTSMDLAQKGMTKAATALSLARKHYWSKLPKQLRNQKPGSRTADLISYMMTTDTDKIEMAKRHGVENTLDAMAERVQEVLPSDKSMTIKEILKVAEENLKNHQTYFDWFTQQGVVSPDMYLKNYVPIIRLMSEAKERGDPRTVAEFLYEERDKKRGKEKVNQQIKDLTDKEFEDLVELVSIDANLEKSKIPTKGQTKEFMEYSRAIDEEFVSQTSRITDIRELEAIYTAKALKKIYFRQLVPAVAQMMKQVNNLDLDKATRKTVDTVIRGYLESITGVPSEMALVMKKANWKTIPNISIRVMNKFSKGWNKSPFGKVTQMVEQEELEHFSADDARQIATTYMYMLYLGGVNWKSPLKNVATQNFHTTAVLGKETWAEGIVKLFSDPAHRKEITKFDPRPDSSYLEDVVEKKKFSSFNIASKMMMTGFRKSDLFNVYGAVSGSWVAWDRLAPFIGTKEQQEAVSLQQVVQSLWQGKKDTRISDAKIMNSSPAESKKFWNGTISKPITMEIHERIKKGQIEEAKNMWTQYIVDTTNWKYGPGGTPILLRNPLIRTFFPFKSWAMNYCSYLGATAVQGTKQAKAGEGTYTLQKYGEAYASQLLMAAILTSLGVAGVQRWFGVGPFSGLHEPGGMFYESLDRLIRMFSEGGEAIQSEMIPGVDQAEKDRNLKNLQDNVNDMFTF